ncbi:protein of unknown function [Sulfitobacter delicatus]|uniref:DUF4376 domain-containing protein n=2 Tax=Sulfitobacter delicatus TaxID=218672 RepID=A0A1G7S8N5_9RHOB|nr:protein of unknown function [Sulfitobacter delicatus]
MQQLLIPISDEAPSGPPLYAGNLRLYHQHLPDRHLQYDDVASLGFAPFVEKPRPVSSDPFFEYVEQAPVEQDADKAWVQNWVRTPVSFGNESDREPLLRAHLLDGLADLRWQRETGGITLPDGTPVRTDRHTQSQLTAAVVQVQAGVLSEVRWKLDTGFVTLSGPEITAIATAVTGHVAACFAAEETVAAQIAAAATVEDLRAIDIQAAFDAALTNAQ